MSSPTPDLPDYCWSVDPACLGDTWASYDESVQDRAVALAVASLRRLTLGRVGGCPITVRPCAQNGCQPLGWHFDGSAPWHPVLMADGSFVNCGCGVSCDCESGCEIKLPGYVGPVTSIVADGVTLDPTKYKIADHTSIVWLGGGTCPFPKNQNLALASGVGTLLVTYLPAHPVDGLGSWAAGLLAVEFAKACTNSTSCRLPRNVTNVVRQGVSYQIASGAFPDGKTGINEVDAWVATYNPNGLTVQPGVLSLDVPSARVYS